MGRGAKQGAEFRPIGPSGDWDWAGALMREFGVGREAFYRAVGAGRIERYQAPGHLRPCYSRWDVARVFGAPARARRVG